MSNTLNIINTKQITCRTYKAFYPQTTPIIYSLSQYTSKLGQYTQVFINGYNFFAYGTTRINFGKYTNIPLTYYSSLQISFIVPFAAKSGCYTVNVANVTNTYPSPTLVYSNSENYCIYTTNESECNC